MECQICKRNFKSITNTHLKTHDITQNEYIEKYGPIRDEILSKTMANKISKALKGRTFTDEHKNNLKNTFTNERKDLISQRMTENNPMFDCETVKKVVNTNRGMGVYEQSSKRMEELWGTDEFRSVVIKRMTENNPMFNQETVIKNAKAHNRLKSGIETKFEEMLDPDIKPMVEYVGNNQIWINGKNPDYIIKGTNRVIEITSDAYHRTVENYDNKRIDIFGEVGYICLCVWMLRVKKRDVDNFKIKLNKRIRRFINESDSGTWKFHN